MTPPPPAGDAADRTARLRRLLAVPAARSTVFASATHAALQEALDLGPDLAGQGVAEVLDAYGPGGDGATAERAADVACQLGLRGAVPALVRAVERLSDHDAVAHAAIRALGVMRTEATGPLLEAFHRASPPGRVLLSVVLVRAGVRDGRVRGVLEGMLEADPRHAAALLSEHGDRGAVPALSAALDRLELLPEGPGELERCEAIEALGGAIRTLRGTLTPAQRDKVKRACARSDDLWLGEPAA
jgi:hypothetical protein